MKAIFKNLISSFASKAAVSVAAIFLMGGQHCLHSQRSKER